MIPGPAPVMTIHPSSAIVRASSRACAYSGSSGDVRADPNISLGSTNYVASEIPVEQRAPILAVYRPLAGKVVEGYWRQLPDDADHPVFALSPKA